MERLSGSVEEGGSKETPPVAELAGVDRISPTKRPDGSPIGYQTWTNLLFVHWRVPAELVRRLIPAGLSLDTWDGDAWVGLVAFEMSGVRPRWFPAIPGVSHFLETNVRTYVHFRGANPGVWFFSLEASNALAAFVARRRWHLNYFRARMTLDRRGDAVRYHSRRLGPGTPGAGCRIEGRIGPFLGHGDFDRALPAGRALPGTLEHFLVERYILYAEDAKGVLYSARVHHVPYPIRDARVEDLDDSLLPAAGIAPPAPPCHVAFSEGVSVEIFPLRPVNDRFR